jgi:hypothetical protein
VDDGVPGAGLAIVTLTVDGSSPVRVTVRTFSVEAQALAEALSSGSPARPTRASARSSHSTAAPPVSRARYAYGDPSSGPSMSGRRRSTGLSFQSTSRPVTAAKAAGSVELKRPERVWTGTRPHPPSLCAPAPCWTPSGAVSVVVGAAADI